jgi:hypothetical protein
MAALLLHYPLQNIYQREKREKCERWKDIKKHKLSTTIK